MNLMLHILLFVLFLHESYGVIYYLNASEYDRMPPIYKLDSYSSCLQEPSDLYCLLNFQLVSDEPNELLHMIEEYSEFSKGHFNHTKLSYGICITKSCQNYIQNKTSVSETILEGCLNQSFWENYNLKTRIQNYSCYSSSDSEVKIDTGDVVAGVIVLVIILLNVVGSLYDVWCTSNKHEGKHILLFFSIKRNWKTLISTTRSNDPRLESLKGINGIRYIFTCITISCHTIFPFIKMAENVQELEWRYHDIFHQSFLSVTLLIQSFFVISGFLMTYKMQRNSEKQSISWGMVPKEIFNRYIRLTPVYAFVVLLLATWYKFIKTGPLLEESIKEEIFDCKERWWINLLYLNNYVDNFRCLPPSWYLAADMQLFCCALILYVLLQNKAYKNTILMSLIVVGGIIGGVHTYVRDVEFNVFSSPNAVTEFFIEDFTFNEIYKSAYGNITGYVIGMYLGYFVYKWQHKEIDKKYWLFNYVCCLSFPLLFSPLISGAILFSDGPRAPLYIRVLLSIFLKPITGVLTAILLAGVIFKFENVFRKIFEWDLWIILSRLCYCVYLVHLPYIMIYMNMQTSLLHMSNYNFIALATYITIASFVTAIPIFLLIEAPFIELSKYLTESPKKRTVIDSKYHKKTE